MCIHAYGRLLSQLSFLCSLLLRVFKWILRTAYVLFGFTASYIVPIPKSSDKATKVLVCEDFRGISVASVLAKLFESCILAICDDLFYTSDHQFGFKSGIGCPQAVHVAQEYIDAYTRGGDTAHIAALDIVKAFPRVNHDAVVVKLLSRNFPLAIIDLISNWFKSSSFYVKWFNCVSDPFTLRTGVNQGSVLAPFIFAILIDDVICNCTNWRRYDQGIIIVYADDILLITRTRRHLQDFVTCVQYGLGLLNLQLNANKCAFMRIGPCFDKPCAPLLSADGLAFATVTELRYLGVTLLSGRSFRVSMARARRSFFRAANCILGRLQGLASEETIFYLIRTKALPSLLYATEATCLQRSEISSLDFTVVRFAMKILKSSNKD
jgi:hypothetical protein